MGHSATMRRLARRSVLEAAASIQISQKLLTAGDAEGAFYHALEAVRHACAAVCRAEKGGG